MNSIKITSSGQITLPRKIRNILDSDVITFEVAKNGNVILKPIRSVAGAFKAHARKDITVEQAREMAWEQLANEWKK